MFMIESKINDMISFFQYTTITKAFQEIKNIFYQL